MTAHPQPGQLAVPKLIDAGVYDEPRERKVFRESRLRVKLCPLGLRVDVTDRVLDYHDRGIVIALYVIGSLLCLKSFLQTAIKPDLKSNTRQSIESRGFLGSVRGLFASPRFALVAVAIALLLTLSSVRNGLIADDYYRRAVLGGSARFEELLRGPQAMMRFLTDDPEHTQCWMDVGFLPWWTDPNIRAEFMQLIPTQTHILDYWLWPDRPELMHVHSLLWFALLVFIAAKFYRRILGPTWMAGVAALLFAVEDGHALPAAWICNRNILIAASFGIGCLIAHDAWRRESRGGALPLALTLWALSLCSKEAGIATCAYLFAYAVWLDESTLRQRFLTLVPYGIVLIVWRALRDSLGYGVAHMGYYADPITDPGLFGRALVERYPVLLFGQ